ncbi:hypothetical protein A33Q_4632 [Indibacter alkaliphilus LW1]|uniref:Uncharacterized protein n=1 Tax=Indibacter alkaliphilus (strain CCUG 57479 / KCTC 22604 / LW1) TaxID=1189612 RepID=S2CYC8_INDAL|nr:hypothetical protein A33Q_4632 [Indibacter alkaliphilus LW1]
MGSPCSSVTVPLTEMSKLSGVGSESAILRSLTSILLFTCLKPKFAWSATSFRKLSTLPDFLCTLTGRFSSIWFWSYKKLKDVWDSIFSKNSVNVSDFFSIRTLTSSIDLYCPFTLEANTKLSTNICTISPFRKFFDNIYIVFCKLIFIFLIGLLINSLGLVIRSIHIPQCFDMPVTTIKWAN